MRTISDIPLRDWIVIITVSVIFAPKLELLSQDAAFRRLQIPKRAYEYKDIDTQIIATDKSFETFIDDIRWQSPNRARKSEFVKALEFARVDFVHEFLLLIAVTEGSISVDVYIDTIYVKSGRLYCHIGRKIPEDFFPRMAFHCIALAVDKLEATEIEIQIERRENISLSMSQPRDVGRAKRQKLTKAYRFGFEAYKSKRYKLACAYFWKVVNMHSTRRYPRAFRYLSDSYLELDKPDSAFVVYKMGRKLLPNNDEIWQGYQGIIEDQ